MRILSLIAATLFAGVAQAQLDGSGCTGDTLSELARCVAEQAPPPPATETEAEADEGDLAPDTGIAMPGMGVAPSTGVVRAPDRGPTRLGGALRPGAVGGALRPTNLHATSPSSAGRSAGARAPRSPRIGMGNFGTIRDPNSLLYGLGRGSIGSSRYDPLSGTGIGTFGIR